MTESGRWEVGLAVGLLAVGAGIAVGNAALFLSSVVGFAYAAYGAVGTAPEPAFAVTREVSPTSPLPGQSVAVSLVIENVGETPLADVRVADDPPADLQVTGPTRETASLLAGETMTIEYELSSKRGTHAFGDVTVVSRTLSGSDVSVETYDGEEPITCTDHAEGLPMAGQTIRHPGRVESDVGGAGTAFYSIRNYHHSDPMNRVDWHRLARTGELTTVEFSEDRAAKIVVAVDVRPENEVVRDPAEADGVALSIHAAAWLTEVLLAEHNQVGVIQYGGDGNYLLPGSGRDQLARARRLLDGEWCGSFGREGWLAGGDRHIGRFCRQLSDKKRIVFVSPLLDDTPRDSMRTIRAYGHDVTLVCPDLVPETPGGTVERIDRDRRVSSLRERGVDVIEWRPDESLHLAIARATKRWSA